MTRKDTVPEQAPLKRVRAAEDVAGSGCEWKTSRVPPPWEVPPKKWCVEDIVKELTKEVAKVTGVQEAPPPLEQPPSSVALLLLFFVLGPIPHWDLMHASPY